MKVELENRVEAHNRLLLENDVTESSVDSAEEKINEPKSKTESQRPRENPVLDRMTGKDAQTRNS